MTAYEMADELESLHLFASQERLAAVMLRQQADRIAELENEISTRSWVRKLVTQLNDEEIIEIFRFSDVASNYYRDTEKFAIEFARAIEAKVSGQ